MGTKISVDISVARSIDDVWKELRDISSHVHWMTEARRIEFLTDQKEGVGTEFDCHTQVGPIKLNDKMIITEWVEGELMSVTHRGIVTGTGSFRLSAIDSENTLLEWHEILSFPWYLGSTLGSLISRPLFQMVWRRNLKEFKSRVES